MTGEPLSREAGEEHQHEAAEEHDAEDQRPPLAVPAGGERGYSGHDLAQVDQRQQRRRSADITQLRRGIAPRSVSIGGDLP